MRSMAPVVWAGSIFTCLSVTTRKPTGCTDTPAPVPPAKGKTSVGTGFCLLSSMAYSPPPATKPKLTRETGTTVLPSAVVIASPTMVFTSIMSRMLSKVVVMMPSMGCFSMFSTSLIHTPMRPEARRA